VTFKGITYHYEYQGEHVLAIQDDAGAAVDNPLIQKVAELDLKLYYKDLYVADG